MLLIIPYPCTHPELREKIVTEFAPQNSLFCLLSVSSGRYSVKDFPLITDFNYTTFPVPRNLRSGLEWNGRDINIQRAE